MKPIAADPLYDIHFLCSRYNRHGDYQYNETVLDHEVLDKITIHRVDKFFDLFTEGLMLVREKDFDIIHSHNLGLSLVGTTLSNLTDCKHIVELHTITQHSFIRKIVEKIELKLADKIIVLSENAQKWLIGEMGCDENKNQIILNGIDPDRFEETEDKDLIREKIGIVQDDVPIIGYIGSFYKFQGVNNFLEMAELILSESQDVFFLMIGNGPEFNEIKSRIVQKGLIDRIKLLDWISPRKIPDYLNTMDVFVIPRPKSLETDTAIPLKLVEAMAMKIPIVGTKVGGLMELIENNYSGILTNSAPEDLAGGVIKIINDDHLGPYLVRNAYSRIKTMTWQEQSDKLKRIYVEITK